MAFERQQRGREEVAPEPARLQVAGEAQQAQEGEGPAVEGGLHLDGAGGQVVADGDAVLPVEYVRPVALVGEAAGWVGEGVLGVFEEDEVGFGEGEEGRVGGVEFVGVVEGRAGRERGQVSHFRCKERFDEGERRRVGHTAFGSGILSSFHLRRGGGRGSGRSRHPAVPNSLLRRWCREDMRG